MQFTLPRVLGTALLAACLSTPPAADAGGFISIGFGRPAYSGYYGGYGGGYYGNSYYNTGYYNRGYYGGYGRPAYGPVYTHSYSYARPVYTPSYRTVSYGHAPAYRHTYYSGGLGNRAYIRDVDYGRRGTDIEYRVVSPYGGKYDVEYKYDRFGRLRDIDIDD